MKLYLFIINGAENGVVILLKNKIDVIYFIYSKKITINLIKNNNELFNLLFRLY